MKTLAFLAFGLFSLSTFAANYAASLPTPSAIVCGWGHDVREATARLNVELADDQGVQIHHAGINLVVARPFTVSSPVISVPTSVCPEGTKGETCGEATHVCVTVSGMSGPIVVVPTNSGK